MLLQARTIDFKAVHMAKAILIKAIDIIARENGAMRVVYTGRTDGWCVETRDVSRMRTMMIRAPKTKPDANDNLSRALRALDLDGRDDVFVAFGRKCGRESFYLQGYRQFAILISEISGK